MRTPIAAVMLLAACSTQTAPATRVAAPVEYVEAEAFQLGKDYASNPVAADLKYRSENKRVVLKAFMQKMDTDSAGRLSLLLIGSPPIVARVVDSDRRYFADPNLPAAPAVELACKIGERGRAIEVTDCSVRGIEKGRK
jgi:hypothetical protein